MRPRCAQLARVLKKTGSFYYHCDWHASHYVKVMLDLISENNNILTVQPASKEPKLQQRLRGKIWLAPLADKASSRRQQKLQEPKCQWL